jgi:hypothetical protein
MLFRIRARAGAAADGSPVMAEHSTNVVAGERFCLANELLKCGLAHRETFACSLV